MVKRVNFNMAEECHALLKSMCALKGITVSEYVLKILNEKWLQVIKEDEQVRTMFLNGNYKEGGDAYLLKESLIQELNTTNDSPA